MLRRVLSDTNIHAPREENVPPSATAEEADGAEAVGGGAIPPDSAPTEKFCSCDPLCRPPTLSSDTVAPVPTSASAPAASAAPSAAIPTAFCSRHCATAEELQCLAAQAAAPPTPEAARAAVHAEIRERHDAMHRAMRSPVAKLRRVRSAPLPSGRGARRPVQPPASPQEPAPQRGEEF